MTGTHKKGFTLVETLVSIGLFSILTAVAIGGFVHALHTQKEIAGLISAQSTVSSAIEQIAREARTGYLFCHNPNSNNPDTCSCSSDNNPNDPTWTCTDLNFFNSDGEAVHYTLQNGALDRSDNLENGGAAEPLTGNDVNVRYLSFQLFGHIEGDNRPPRITIVLGISPSSTDPAVANDILHFETSVSARQIDCTQGVPIPQC